MPKRSLGDLCSFVVTSLTSRLQGEQENFVLTTHNDGHCLLQNIIIMEYYGT